MKKTWKKWTEEEEQFLIKNYSTLSAVQCAKQLDRTITAIKVKASHLNITKSQENWSKLEIEFLIENYSILGPSECAQKLNKLPRAVKTKANTLNITKCKLGWTEKEKNFLINNYPDRGPTYCAKNLKKSINAVSKKAQRLNIQTNTRYNSNIVYIVYFPEIFLYKVGITNSIERRMNEFGQSCVILKTVEYETAQEAAEVERCLLKSVTLVNTGALNNGNTETFIQPSQEIKDFLGEKFSNL